MRYTFYSVVLIFIFLVVHETPLAGQDDQYTYRADFLTKFDNFTTRDGLSDNHVLDIFQDKHGYLWIATRGGLNRFDGYRFVHFRYHPKDTTTLSHDYVTAIVEDAYGDLWIGTHDGLNKYNRETGDFIRVKHDPFDANLLSHNHIRAMYADSAGNLWVETLDGVLNKYAIKEKKFTHYLHEPIPTTYYDYHDIYQDQEGFLWIGGRDMGPYRFDKKTGKFRFFKADKNDPDKKRDNDIACFYQDSRRNFWITATDGVYQYDQQRNVYHKFLPTSTYDVIEDRRGEIWFATGNGVYKYNPRSDDLFHFREDQNNPYSILTNDINKVYEDHNGNIWIGTDQGLSKHSPGKFKFQHVYHIPGNEQTIASNHITSIIQDRHGMVWIGTDEHGLDRVNPKNWRIDHFKSDPGTPDGLSSNRIADLYEDRSGMIWIGLWQGIGFDRYDPDTESFTLFSYNPNTLKLDWYNDFAEDSAGNFWVGFWGAQGVKKFDRTTETFLKDSYNPKRVPYREEIFDLHYDAYTNQLLVLTFNKVFIRSDDSGAYRKLTKGKLRHIIRSNDSIYWIIKDQHIDRYNIRSNSLRSISLANHNLIEGRVLHSAISERSEHLILGTSRGLFELHLTETHHTLRPVYEQFAKRTIRCIFKDVEGQYWIGTSEGLFVIKPDEQKVKRITRHDSLNIDRSNRILQSQSNNIWVATENGLFRIHHKTYQSTLFQVGKDNEHAISGKLVHSVTESASGSILIATNKGLNVYDPALQEMVHYTRHSTPGLIEDDILSISENREGDIWLGTTKGLFLFKTAMEKCIPFNFPGKFSVSSRLTSRLLTGSNGFVWVGTTNRGVNRINPDNNEVKHFLPDTGHSASLNGAKVNAIYEDSRNYIWVGTDKGLNLFDPENNSFKTFTMRDGLSHNEVKAIEEDRNGALWISTANGLNRFHPEDKSVLRFYESDGLQANNFTDASCRLDDGRIIFGGENGLNIINPEALNINDHLPEVRITGFKVFDQYRFGGEITGGGIELHYQDNFFTIEFSSLDFTSIDKNQYRYQLKGIDPHWVDAGNKGEAIYTDIRPGTYQFLVKGSNNDGYWSRKPATITLVIKPPFYLSGWFLISVFLTMAITVYFLVRMRIQRLKAEKYTIELEQKFLRTQMNPHFIFNSLTSIQNYIMDQDSKKANHYLARFSKLIRFILDNSRSDYISLKQEIQTLDHYLMLQKMRFSNKFSYAIELHNQMDAERILVPPMLTQPFVENSIEHGFRFLEREGKIDIHFIVIDDLLKITIEDNGIGINQSMSMKKDYPETHKSHSTDIIKERIENMNRFSKAKIKVVIMDLSFEEENHHGTRVVLYVPLRLDDSFL